MVIGFRFDTTVYQKVLLDGLKKVMLQRLILVDIPVLGDHTESLLSYMKKN
jgi:hypothetical protein